MQRDNSPQPAPSIGDVKPAPPVLRWFLLLFGFLMVGLGVVGIFIPGLPTTVFLIIAVWAFARSSSKFHKWLVNHPRLGPPLRDWFNYRVIPVRAKILAVAMMALSVLYMAYVVDGDLEPVLILGAVLLPAAFYVCSRESVRPKELESEPEPEK